MTLVTRIGVMITAERQAAACMQVLDRSSTSSSPYKAVVGSDSWAIALTVEELQSFVQARHGIPECL